MSFYQIAHRGSMGRILADSDRSVTPDRWSNYSNFAWKAKTPDEAIPMVSHLMNNFDRTMSITIDEPSTGAKSEGAAS